jgi:hypothetical protein
MCRWVFVVVEHIIYSVVVVNVIRFRKLPLHTAMLRNGSATTRTQRLTAQEYHQPAPTAMKMTMVVLAVVIRSICSQSAAKTKAKAKGLTVWGVPAQLLLVARGDRLSHPP